MIQDSSTGALLGTLSSNGDFTAVNNVFANMSHRFPNTTAGVGQQCDVVNNIVYNWKARLSRVEGEGDYNFINNYYKPSANGLWSAGWYNGGTIGGASFK